MKINTTVTAGIFLTAASTLTAFAPRPVDAWQLQPNAKANFTIDGMMGMDVNGTLAFRSALIRFDPAHPEQGKMEALLTVGTIATGIGKRDKHLKSDDYFEAGKYPDITFASTRIERAGNSYRVAGNLKIKAASRPVTIPFTFSQTGSEGLFKGSFNISRSDYGIGTGKESGMGNEVRIKLNIPVKKG